MIALPAAASSVFSRRGPTRWRAAATPSASSVTQTMLPRPTPATKRTAEFVVDAIPAVDAAAGSAIVGFGGLLAWRTLREGS